jgi:hypothetical protein
VKIAGMSRLASGGPGFPIGVSLPASEETERASFAMSFVLPGIWDEEIVADTAGFSGPVGTSIAGLMIHGSRALLLDGFGDVFSSGDMRRNA